MARGGAAPDGRRWSLRRASLASLVACLMVVPLLLLARDTQAARRIVYLGFSGVQGGEATRLIGRFLSGRFELVSGARFAQEARRRGVSPGTPGGRSIGARAVKAVAVLSGQVTRSGGRLMVRATVYGASNGLPVGSVSLPLHGRRIDPLAARRVMTRLLPALARARPGAPVAAVAAGRAAPRPSPPAAGRGPTRVPPRRAPAGFDDGSERGDPGDGTSGQRRPVDDDPQPVPTPPPRTRRPVANSDGTGEGDAGETGFDVGEDDRSSPRRSRSDGVDARRGRARGANHGAQVRKPAGARADWEKLFELSAGLMLLNRSFDFNDPIKPETPRNYRSGMVPAILLDGGIYPLALFGHNALSGLGVVGSYYRVPVLRSKVDGTETDTTLQQWELGLRYRWNLLGRASSPTLRAGLSVGQLGFVINYDPGIYSGAIPLPNVAYIYLKFALVQLEVPFYTGRSFSMGGLVSFDYLHVFNAGPIERTDSGGYGDSNTGGIDVGGGLFMTFSGFFVRATGFYRRMFFTFSNSCFEQGMSCNAAGGALDIYQGATIVAGYAY